MFSQRDQRWADVRLGTGATTIGAAGCLLCCVAYALAKDGHRMTPAGLNRWLTLNDGYIKGDRLVFNAPNKLGTPLVDICDWSDHPADLAMLRRHYANGSHILLEVLFNPYQPGRMHWVYLRDWLQDDMIVGDPWIIADCSAVPARRLLETFAQPTWDLARTILRAAIYERGG